MLHASLFNMNKPVIIVSNGELGKWIINNIHVGDFVIGVDRAAYWLITHKVIPDVAIGDFDSTGIKERTVIQKKVKVFKQYSPEKDFTDTELALVYAFTLHPSLIIIYGGSGTRMDHTLGTIHLLERCQRKGIPAVFYDQTNELRVVGRGRTILEKRVGKRYVSVIPVSDSISISLQGFKYNITQKTIRRGQTIGISNEFAGRPDCAGKPAEITLHHGVALIIQSGD
jgi:thiamine pyrophosphokinase